MAAVSLSHYFPIRKTAIQALGSRNRSNPRVVMVASYQGHEPAEESSSDTQKGKKRRERELLFQILTHVQKIGTDLKENLSPQRKGDWKDLTLMSLSFAVYVYVSQKIVCAYFAWMSIPNQSW